MINISFMVKYRLTFKFRVCVEFIVRFSLVLCKD